MKTQIKTLTFALILVASSVMAQNPDSMKVITNYSLFSEYHKNKDYESALPYGWSVIEANPTKFSKWIYFKMEDCLWALHDSSSISAEEKKAIEDTVYGFYELAIKYRPEDRGYFEVKQAYVGETWLNYPADKVIADYVQAFEVKPDLSFYYYDRLGMLYANNASDENDYKLKALELYRDLSEREPDNPLWNEKLKGLVDNVDELVAIYKKTWELEPESEKKAWDYASMAMQASSFEEAIAPLEFLVSKQENELKYWSQLAKCYKNTDKMSKAENAIKKLIQLEPTAKEHYINLGLIYKDQGKYSAARSEFQKASDVGNGWAYPIYLEATLYEQAARGCEFNFETKLVYLLAQNTYRRAASMDASLNEARERVGALSSSVPTKEDYFFRNYKSGTVIPINDGCFGWIGKSVTVP